MALSPSCGRPDPDQRWQHEGRFTWISPHGRIYLTDARGTHVVSMEIGTDPIEVHLDEYALAT